MDHKKTPELFPPLDNSIYEYLKNNHQSFDIEAFFRRYEEHGPDIINATFKNVINRLASNKRRTNYKQWAYMVKKLKYAILDSNRAHLFWAQNARFKSQLQHDKKCVNNELIAVAQSSSLSTRSSLSEYSSERSQESGDDEWNPSKEASYSTLDIKENRKTKDTFESEYLRMLPEIKEEDKVRKNEGNGSIAKHISLVDGPFRGERCH
ncbi:hypothetical protein BJV82DRAFT_314935 [Fennellomyces sp. T-0311]|nr:hypothetical protein BJV82DRAFT_314935 [Fennellomyces sp. T-0311]